MKLFLISNIMSLKVICQVLMFLNPKKFPKTHYKACECSEKLCKLDLRYYDPKSKKVKNFLACNST